MKKILVLLVVLALSMFGVSAAFAYDVKVDEDTYAKFGVKAVIQFKMTNPDTANDRVDVLGTQGRLYASGQVNNLVKFGLNFDMARGRDAAGAVPAATSSSLSDIMIWFDMAKEAKLNTGIYRMPVSRKALQDTYQIMFVNQPDVASSTFLTRGSTGTGTGSTNLASYRGAGLTLWGDLLDGKVRYNVSTWDGDFAPNFDNLTNPNDELGLSARVVFNFLDPEKGYTCSGCYLGKSKVANIGAGYLTWKDQVDNVTGAKRDYTMTTVDAYYDADNLTAEAAYFMYDLDNANDQKQTAWYVELGYAIDKIQPAVRYESFDSDFSGTATNTDYEKYSVGLNYLIEGHNAKVQLEYASKDYDLATTTDVDTTTLQLIIQF